MLKRRGIAWVFVAAAAVVFGANVSAVRAQSPEEMEKIEQAMPVRATAKPAKSRKILVFSLCTGFKHSAVPYGEKALEIMGRKTGAFTVETTTSTEVFRPETLKKYDAIVMNNCTGENFTTAESRDALLSFVRNGKGIIGIHAATDCEYQWPAYGELIGGYFDGHPWGAGDTVVVKVCEPGHPLTKAFKGKELTIKEEMYQFKDPYSRSRSLVLTALDVDKIDMTKKGIKRADKDFAVSWVHPYGKGRVFFCSLGHNHDMFWNPVVLQHYLDGIQFALGDLKADAKPRKGVAREMLLKGFPAALRGTAQCVVGGNEKFSTVDTMIRTAGTDPGLRREMARRIAAFLSNPGETTLTLASRQFLLEKLSEIGGEEDAPSLAPMLLDADPNVSDAARRALERLPGESVDRLLRKAASQTGGNTRIGIVLALGTRRDRGGVAILSELAGKTTTDAPATAGVSLSEACVWSLGRIGTPEAALALKQAWKESGQNSPAVAGALMECADQLFHAGRQRDATALCRELYEQEKIPSVRAAALIRLAEKTGSRGRDLALKELFSGDPLLQTAAAGFVLRMKGDRITAQLVRKIPQLTTPSQVVVLGILGARGDSSALPVMRKKTSDEDEAVRIAALKGLGLLGNASVAGLLLESAAKSRDEERDVTRESLAKLAGGDVNGAILAVLRVPPGETDDQLAAHRRAEAVRALLARRAEKALPSILKAAEDQAAEVQEQAWVALAEMARPANMDALVGLLDKANSDKVRGEAEKAIVETARRIKDESSRADAVVAGLAPTPEANTRVSLYRILGRIGNDKALATLRAARAEGQSGDVQDAVIRALVDYPDSKALTDVFDIAHNSKSEVHRVLAVRSLARLLALPGDRPTSDTVAYCREALELAKRPEDRKAVIGGLAEISQPEVLLLVIPFLDDADLRDEAAAAVLKLAADTYSFAPQDADAALEKIAEISTDKEQQKKARNLRKEMQTGDGTIPGWRVAGPYEAEGKGPGELLETPFAPEQSGHTDIVWKAVGSQKGPKSARVVDLGEVLGGENRVAYLRARVFAPHECEATIMVGSDDAAKVWLNGKAVHTSAAATRAYKPDQDRMKVELRSGWNHLMLKVVQGKAEWRASARVVSISEEKIDGLKTDALDVQDTKAFIGEPSDAVGAARGR